MISKENWKYRAFGELVTHYEETEKDEKNRQKSLFVGVEHLKTNQLKLKEWGKDVMPTYFRKFYEGDILFAKRRAYQRKVAIAPFDGICSPHIWVLRTKGGLLHKLLPFIMQRNAFYDYVNAHSAGTMSPYIKWNALSKYEIPLPPKPDQEKILSLFTTLEQLIEASETQSHNLLQLKQKLLADLLKEKPVFGNILQKSDCQKVTLQKVAKEMRQSEKNPLENGLTRFVSLSHIEAGKLNISNWGNIAEGTTFTRKFEAGDVLFGRRRAYLKKAALADFEGLCSGDIIVLRAIPQQILPNLLPYYVSADAVFDFAVSQSAGSLSPRVKWKDLGKFDFWLPSKETQAKILEVLQHLDALVDEVEQQSATLKELKQSLLDEILG